MVVIMAPAGSTTTKLHGFLGVRGTQQHGEGTYTNSKDVAKTQHHQPLLQAPNEEVRALHCVVIGWRSGVGSWKEPPLVKAIGTMMSAPATDGAARRALRSCDAYSLAGGAAPSPSSSPAATVAAAAAVVVVGPDACRRRGVLGAGAGGGPRAHAVLRRSTM